MVLRSFFLFSTALIIGGSQPVKSGFVEKAKKITKSAVDQTVYFCGAVVFAVAVAITADRVMKKINRSGKGYTATKPKTPPSFPGNGRRLGPN